MTPFLLQDPVAPDPVVTSFGHDSLLVIVVKVLAIFAMLPLITLLTIWAERRVVARMQQRLGPNRVGPFGLLQSLADGIKLFLKEDIRPASADRWVYVLAPIMSTVPAFLALSVIPFGPSVRIGDTETPLQLTDLPVGVLFILAMSSLGVYGVVLAGWSSGSAYPLLGALRSSAQMISYEVAMGLSLVAVFLYSGSLSTADIVASQQDRWLVISLFPSFVIYCIAAVGETNRAPFDLPEAESELVAGFHTEYSSAKFALFFLAEYINMVTVSALATTMFLGGWRPPPIPVVSGLTTGAWPLLWFFLKIAAFLFVFIWLRGTLPRYRYDQFMALGWKRLIPISLGWLVVVATARTAVEELDRSALVRFGAVAVGLIALLAFLPSQPRSAPMGNPFKGFWVTFRTMFKKVNTVQYPDVKEPTQARFHGRHQLNRHADGLEKCVGCELCAWACPADAIYVEGADNTEEERFSPGERYGAIYQINYLRCIFCGLCIEACPTRALTMTNEYELADDSREDLIFTKEDLLAPLLEGMLQPPHPMLLGDEKAYYGPERREAVRTGDTLLPASHESRAD